MSSSSTSPIVAPAVPALAKADGRTIGDGPRRCPVSRWLLAIALGVQAAVVACLLVLSLVFTCVFQRKDAPMGPAALTEDMTMHFGTPSLAFILGCVLLLVVLGLVAYGVARLSPHVLLVFVLSFVTIAQILWIFSLGLTSVSYPDSQSLLDGAAALVDGDVSRYAPDFCPTGDTSVQCTSRPYAVPSPYAYFSFYPFQTGPMLWYVLTGSVFGTGNILAFQVLNAAAITGLVAVLWWLGTLIGLTEYGRGALAVLVVTCVPLLMFAAFVYPNAIGFSITIAGVALIALAFSRKRVWSTVLCLVGGFLVCGLGVIFKSTFIILMIAAIIGVLLVVIANRRWWQGLVGIVAMGVSYMLTKLPLYMVQRVTGQDFGKGMPMLSWITLGLDDPVGVNPGWWTRTPLRAFQETGGDYASQSAIAREFVASRLQHFAQHPSEALDFFSRKLASEWAEPTFMTALYSELGTSSSGFAGAPRWLLAGGGSGLLLKYENVAQSVLYLLALVGVIAMVCAVVRSARMPMGDAPMFARTFLCTAFLGGFICYMFWEAKGIYTLPFYLLLFPMAAYGVQVTLRALCRRRQSDPIRESGAPLSRTSQSGPSRFSA